MKIHVTISEIKEFLSETFAEIDQWFDKPFEIRSFRPPNGGWTINEILEHIGLTNHYLLILIDKGVSKSLQQVAKVDLNTMLEDYHFQRDRLTEIGIHKSFTWIRPEHMEPKRDKTVTEVRYQLSEQLNRCLTNLEKLKNGEGILYKTTMSVNNLGKIDVYEYIYFLAQHGRRHIIQMQKNEQEYNTQNG